MGLWEITIPNFSIKEFECKNCDYCPKGKLDGSHFDFKLPVKLQAMRDYLCELLGKRVRLNISSGARCMHKQEEI